MGALFLGFDLREAKNRRGKRFILRTPKRKKQQELLRRVSGILKHSQHRKVKEVISLINPVIVGWMNYFRVGNCAQVFDRIRYEVMKKVRRFVMRQRVRYGFGWKRWSNEGSTRIGDLCGIIRSNTFTDRPRKYSQPNRR
jgi:RNA-directed DNA polymerase